MGKPQPLASCRRLQTILMAFEIGAATEGQGTLLMSRPSFRAAKQTTQVGFISAEPNTIWVNKNGERFIDEE